MGCDTLIVKKEPCGIRTAVYEDIMPTIASDEIIPCPFKLFTGD